LAPRNATQYGFVVSIPVTIHQGSQRGGKLCIESGLLSRIEVNQDGVSGLGDGCPARSAARRVGGNMDGLITPLDAIEGIEDGRLQDCTRTVLGWRGGSRYQGRVQEGVVPVGDLVGADY
jgi:hypothetical protein